MSNKAGNLKAGSPKGMAALSFAIGLLDLILIPIALTFGKQYNYNVAVVNSVVAVIVIIIAFVDYLGKKKGSKGTALPAILFVFSLILIFMYPQTYDTPYIGTYHLYIIPTVYKGNPYYLSPWQVQNYVWSLSFAFGMMLFVTSLYEIYLIKKS
ncbi:MAG: hypothetical protein ACP5LS_00050 [Thermoprotei archaeon]